jgi:hypothetical protein
VIAFRSETSVFELVRATRLEGSTDAASGVPHFAVEPSLCIGQSFRAFHRFTGRASRFIRLRSRRTTRKPEKIALGKTLFFDTRLSTTRRPAQPAISTIWALPTSSPLPRVFATSMGQRNVPTILNAMFNVTQFWDRRAQLWRSRQLRVIILLLMSGFVAHCMSVKGCRMPGGRGPSGVF